MVGIWAVLAGTDAFAEQKKINMITYFPAPYVAYPQANVTTRMDVGLQSSDKCRMTLGCSARTGASPLLLQDADEEAGGIFIQSGKLFLDGKDSSHGIIIESNNSAQAPIDLGNTNGNATVKFEKNLRLFSNLTSSNPAKSVWGNTISVRDLRLFDDVKSFPSCKSVSGKPDVSWQFLDVTGPGQKMYYLTCGLKPACVKWEYDDPVVVCGDEGLPDCWTSYNCSSLEMAGNCRYEGDIPLNSNVSWYQCEGEWTPPGQSGTYPQVVSYRTAHCVRDTTSPGCEGGVEPPSQEEEDDDEDLS